MTRTALTSDVAFELILNRFLLVKKMIQLLVFARGNFVRSCAATCSELQALP